MKFLIILVIFIVVYITFIKKGKGGKSFFNFRKDLHKYIKQNGGMRGMYKDFISVLMNHGFSISKTQKGLIELKKTTGDGNIEFQIIQSDKDEANIAASNKSIDGKIFDAAITFKKGQNQKKAAAELLKKVLSNNSFNTKNTSDKRNEFKESKNSEKNYSDSKLLRQMNSGVDENPEKKQKHDNSKNLTAQNYKNEDYSLIHKLYLRLLERVQSNMIEQNKLDIDKTVSLICKYHNKGDYINELDGGMVYTEIKKMISAAISKEPKNSLGYFARGCCYVNNKYFDSVRLGVRDFELGMRLGGGNCKRAYENTIKLYKENGNFNKIKGKQDQNPLIIESIRFDSLNKDDCEATLFYKQIIGNELIRYEETYPCTNLDNMLPVLSKRISNMKKKSGEDINVNIVEPIFGFGNASYKKSLTVYESHKANYEQHDSLEKHAKQNKDGKYLTTDNKLIFRNIELSFELDENYESKNNFIAANGCVSNPVVDALHKYDGLFYKNNKISVVK